MGIEGEKREEEREREVFIEGLIVRDLTIGIDKELIGRETRRELDARPREARRWRASMVGLNERESERERGREREREKREEK